MQTLFSELNSKMLGPRSAVVNLFASPSKVDRFALTPPGMGSAAAAVSARMEDGGFLVRADDGFVLDVNKWEYKPYNTVWWLSEHGDPTGQATRNREGGRSFRVLPNGTICCVRAEHLVLGAKEPAAAPLGRGAPPPPPAMPVAVVSDAPMIVHGVHYHAPHAVVEDDHEDFGGFDVVETANPATMAARANQADVPPLANIAHMLGYQLSLSGNFVEVVDAACEQLGVSAAGKSLTEKATACWQMMNGS